MKFKLYPPDQLDKYLYIDVVVLVFLFYNVLSTASPLGLGGDLLLLGLFLFAFYMMLWHRDWRLLLFFLLGCCILTIWGILYDQWFLLYGFVVADLLGRAHKKRVIAVGMVGIVGMYLVIHQVNTGDPFSFVTTVLFPILIIQLLVPIIIHIRERSKALKRELDVANEKLERYIQEEERNRIARDLHDTLGQTLTMITMKGELAVRLLDRDKEKAKREITEVIATSRHALKQVRELVTSMKHVGLEDEIQHASQLLEVSGVSLTIQRNATLPKLSSLTETMLALSVREAITNLIKHSQATQCILGDELKDGWYKLWIEDNGVGIGEGKGGNGIPFMRERMRLVQGEVILSTPAKGGSRVTLKVPVKEEKG